MSDVRVVSGPPVDGEALDGAIWIILCLEETGGNLLKARRLFLRRTRWSESQWYRHWRIVGAAMEAWLRDRQPKP